MPLPPPTSRVPRSRPPHAGELFTDRETESQSFKSALRAFRRRLDHPDAHVDVRHNVLTYYGVGGVGKSTLSVRLQAWVEDRLPLVNGWGSRPDTKVDAAVRVDLHTSTGQLDLLSLVLAIRNGLMPLRPTMPVFDLAFAAYWSAVNPGVPLPPASTESGMRDAMLKTIGDVVGELGDLGTSVGLGIRGVRHVVNELRRRHQRITAFRSFEGYEEFVSRCVDEPSPTSPRPELLAEIAYLLSYELSLQEHTPLVVVFVDTTERLRLDHRREAEYLLNALVYQLPNILFVLTGRNLIDWWDDRRGNLYAAGRATWPGLVPGASEDPRQHLVGKLSADDTRDVILRARKRDQLPLPDSVVDKLVDASAGLPQYLELARQVAVTIRDSGAGRDVTVEDITGSLGDLVTKVLDDIPGDEQRAIRAGALFRAFDPQLVAAAAAVDHGCAERAVQRPMIDMVPGERLPYRMHDEIRTAIRLAGSGIEGGWSRPDWRAAATRAIEETRRMYERARVVDDRFEAQHAVATAITVLCYEEADVPPAEVEGYDDWLSEVIVRAPSIAGLRPHLPTSSETPYGEMILKFVDGKSERPFDERTALLREIFSSDHPLAIPAGRHLAYALRGRCYWDESLEVLDELARLAPSELHRRQRASTLTLARRFQDALDSARGFPEEVAVRRRIAYAHGRIDAAYFDALEQYVENLREKWRAREVLEETGTVLARRNLLLGDRPIHEATAHLDECERLGHSVGTRDGLMALVVHDQADEAAVATALERLETLDRVNGDGIIGFRAAFAQLWQAYVTDDDEAAKRLRAEVDARPLSRGRPWIVTELLFETMSLPLTPVETQWMEPYDDIVARWRGHFERAKPRYAARSRGLASRLPSVG